MVQELPLKLKSSHYFFSHILTTIKKAAIIIIATIMVRRLPVLILKYALTYRSISIVAIKITIKMKKRMVYFKSGSPKIIWLNHFIFSLLQHRSVSEFLKLNVNHHADAKQLIRWIWILLCTLSKVFNIFVFLFFAGCFFWRGVVFF